MAGPRRGSSRSRARAPRRARRTGTSASAATASTSRCSGRCSPKRGNGAGPAAHAGPTPAPPPPTAGDAGPRRPRYCTFTVSDAFALSVKVQVFTLLPPLLHAPDQIASRLFDTRNVMLVPVAKVAEPVVPTGTLRPDGVEETVSPLRPLAERVSCASCGGGGGATVPPQTFATPPPPQVWGAVHVPQTSVPPHPSEMEPQFLPCALHVVGVQVSGLLMNRVWLTQLRPTHAESTAAESAAGTLVVIG